MEIEWPQVITKCPHQDLNTDQLCNACLEANDMLDECKAAVEKAGKLDNKKLEIWKDDECEGFAAFCAGSSSEKPMIVLNVAGILDASLKEGMKPKEFFLECLIHEFGHFIEEMFNREFNEDFVEKVVQSYRDKYFPEIGQPSQAVNEDLLEALYGCIESMQNILKNREHCGDPDWECPLQDEHKNHDWTMASKLDKAKNAIAKATAAKEGK